MRKTSKQAQHITQLIHQLMQAIESNDPQSRIRAFSDAWCIDRADREQGGTGYSLKWFFNIADQYPAALAADPRLVQAKANWETERRAYIRGKGDYTRGCVGNPYCAYTNEIAYEAWEEGWQAAAKADDDYDDYDWD